MESGQFLAGLLPAGECCRRRVMACSAAFQTVFHCRAVAENQPFPTNNRMTSELTSFAAHVRGFMAESLSAFSPCSGEPASDQQFNKFNTLALELFTAQFALNPAYRRICEARGVTPG